MANLADLTVMIPTRNRPQYLMRALESLAQQTLKPSQTIVADNSNDSSSESVVESFDELIPNLFYTRHETNIGAFRNWQYCAQNVSTTFAKFLWDDDWLEPNFIEVMMHEQKVHNADAVLCAAYGHVLDKHYIWYRETESFTSNNWHETLPLIISRALPNSPLAGIQLSVDIYSALFEFAYPSNCITDELVVGPDYAVNLWALASGRTLRFVSLPLVHMFGDGQNMTNRTPSIFLQSLYKETLEEMHKSFYGRLSSKEKSLFSNMLQTHRTLSNTRLSKFLSRIKFLPRD